MEKVCFAGSISTNYKKNEQTDIIDVTKKIQVGRRKDAK
jgi:hypothetical protein